MVDGIELNCSECGDPLAVHALEGCTRCACPKRGLHDEMWLLAPGWKSTWAAELVRPEQATEDGSAHP
jgi:hypothetical protein